MQIQAGTSSLCAAVKRHTAGPAGLAAAFALIEGAGAQQRPMGCSKESHACRCEELSAPFFAQKSAPACPAAFAGHIPQRRSVFRARSGSITVSVSPAHGASHRKKEEFITCFHTEASLFTVLPFCL
jgi:hypothetical protein